MAYRTAKSGVVERFRRRYILYIVTAEIQTANVDYFQRKIQLSGFSAYPDGSPCQLIQIIGVVLYTKKNVLLCRMTGGFLYNFIFLADKFVRKRSLPYE
jgi:hypothetical protein